MNGSMTVVCVMAAALLATLAHGGAHAEPSALSLTFSVLDPVPSRVGLEKIGPYKSYAGIGDTIRTYLRLDAGIDSPPTITIAGGEITGVTDATMYDRDGNDSTWYHDYVVTGSLMPTAGSAFTFTITLPGEQGMTITPAQNLPENVGLLLPTIDVTRPTATAQFTAADTIVLAFDEALQFSQRVYRYEYGVTVGTVDVELDGSAPHEVQLGQSRITLTLASDATQGVEHTIRLPSKIRDRAGNAPAAQTVSASYAASIAFTAETSTRTSTVITFDRPVSGTTALGEWGIGERGASAPDIAVTGVGTAGSESLAIPGQSARSTLTIFHGELGSTASTPEVSYTTPASGGLSGGQDGTLRVGSTGALPVMARDGAPPTLVSHGFDAYGLQVTATFSEPLGSASLDWVAISAPYMITGVESEGRELVAYVVPQRREGSPTVTFSTGVSDAASPTPNTLGEALTHQATYTVPFSARTATATTTVVTFTPAVSGTFEIGDWSLDHDDDNIVDGAIDAIHVGTSMVTAGSAHTIPQGSPVTTMTITHSALDSTGQQPRVIYSDVSDSLSREGHLPLRVFDTLATDGAPPEFTAHRADPFTESAPSYVVTFSEAVMLAPTKSAPIADDWRLVSESSSEGIMPSSVMVDLARRTVTLGATVTDHATLGEGVSIRYAPADTIRRLSIVDTAQPANVLASPVTVAVAGPPRVVSAEFAAYGEIRVLFGADIDHSSVPSSLDVVRGEAPPDMPEDPACSAQGSLPPQCLPIPPIPISNRVAPEGPRTLVVSLVDGRGSTYEARGDVAYSVRLPPTIMGSDGSAFAGSQESVSLRIIPSDASPDASRVLVYFPGNAPDRRTLADPPHPASRTDGPWGTLRVMPERGALPPDAAIGAAFDGTVSAAEADGSYVSIQLDATRPSAPSHTVTIPTTLKRHVAGDLTPADNPQLVNIPFRFGTNLVPAFTAALTSPTTMTVTFTERLLGFAESTPSSWIIDLTPATFPGAAGDVARHLEFASHKLSNDGMSMSLTLPDTSAQPADATPTVRYLPAGTPNFETERTCLQSDTIEPVCQAYLPRMSTAVSGTIPAGTDTTALTVAVSAIVLEDDDDSAQTPKVPRGGLGARTAGPGHDIVITATLNEPASISADPTVSVLGGAAVAMVDAPGDYRQTWTHVHRVVDGAPSGPLTFEVAAIDGLTGTAATAAQGASGAIEVDTSAPTIMSAHTTSATITVVTLGEPVIGDIVASEWLVNGEAAVSVADGASGEFVRALRLSGDMGFALMHGDFGGTAATPTVVYTPATRDEAG